MCQVLGVKYHALCVTCRLSHVTNANSHSPVSSQDQLLNFAGLDLDPSIMNRQDPQIHTLAFDHFWEKITNSKTNVRSSLFSKKFYCHY